MEQTGPQRASELGQRLAARLENDRKEIETLTTAQLTKLSESLSDSVQRAVHTIELDIERLNVAQVRSQWRNWTRPTLIGLSLFLGVLIGTSGLMLYLSDSISEKLAKREALDKEIAKRHEVIKVMPPDWGLTFQETKGGRFIVLPIGTSGKIGWTIGENPAVKLLKE